MSRAARRRSQRQRLAIVEGAAGQSVTLLRAFERYVTAACFRWFWAQIAIVALLQHFQFHVRGGLSDEAETPKAFVAYLEGGGL